VACFARHFGRSPDQLGPEEIRQYQVYLVEQKKASWSAFNQAVCALRFLYGTTLRRNWPVTMIPFGKKPKTLPAVLGQQEYERLYGQCEPQEEVPEAASLTGWGLRVADILRAHGPAYAEGRETLPLGLLDHHPHVHCVAPGGAWSAEGRWIAASEGKQKGRKRKAFFLPVKALSRLFRGKSLDGLKRLHAQGRLKLEGKRAHLADRKAFQRWLTPLYQKEWVVFCEAAPNGCDGPEAVLKYLACYVAGAAISDKRLISHDGGRVTFWARDPGKKGKGKRRRPRSLDGEEFVRRYLMHVLPRGFQRVRYYGLFSHRQRATQEQVRAALQGVDAVGTAAEPAVPEASEAEQPLAKTCSACGQGTLQARVSAETPLSWFDVLMASPYATAADRAWWEDCPCRARPPTSGPLTEVVR
ncbi:MAG: hypothetical protein GXY83_29860, partial [Rhodopirellula sp.]|nr:hypothetical protein [Rhodopirellula sp.]